MSHKILLVEDEENLAKAILLNLELEGYAIDWIQNGNTAEKTLQQKPNFYGLIILDVMLPEKDGFEICKSLRKHDLITPVLFLSARNSSSDKVTGLKAGADDYMGKPFNLEEFLLRVQILLNRNTLKDQPSSVPNIKIGSCEVNFASLSISNKNGALASLTLLESNLLRYLFDNSGKVISREELIESVWKGNSINGRSIDNLISKFRKWFEKDPKHPVHFISIRGIGYRFEN
ncbi:MAG: response regulator transcription factor [Salibacteraceae bacterium]